MPPVLFGVLVSTLWARAASSSFQRDDAVCSLQTSNSIQGQSLQVGDAEPFASANSTTAEFLQHRQWDGAQAVCSATAAIHMFYVYYAQHAVTGGIRYTYTLVPTPAPKNAAGISHINFEFDQCTCAGPNQFSDLEMLEFADGGTTGSSIPIVEECGPKGKGAKTHLKFDSVGDKKGQKYTVSFTIGDDNLGTEDVTMIIKAGPTYYSGSICGPICRPPSPTQSVTPSPTGLPTPTPTETGTPSPTGPPTLSPTDSPTASPTGFPAPSPTDAPTTSPAGFPAPSPTDAPAASPTGDSATSFGDPHVSNVNGERFNILQPDYHTFLAVPRGVNKDQALLHVLAKVDYLGPLCSGLLYVTALKFSGLWVGEAGSLEFSTTVDAAMDAEQAVQIKVGSSPYLTLSQFKTIVNRSVVPETTVFQPEEPQTLNQGVDTLLVKLALGPTSAKVRMVHQKEREGFSNSFWLTATGLKHANCEIGGILGLDSHEVAASPAAQCIEGMQDDDAHHRNGQRAHIHAVAVLGSID